MKYGLLYESLGPNVLEISELTLIFHGLEHFHIKDELPRAGTKVLITEVTFSPIYTLYTYSEGNFTQFFKNEFVSLMGRQVWNFPLSVM